MDLHVEEGYLLGGVFKSGFDHGVEVVHEIFHELDLFGGFKEDHGDVIMNLFPERDCPDEGFPEGFCITAHEEVGIRWDSLGSHGCADKLEKMPVHE